MPYTVRQRQPAYHPKGLARTAVIEVDLDGAPVSAPSAATYTLRDAAGTAVTGLSAAVATPAVGGASIAIGASVLDNESYSSDYTETWALTMGGVVYLFDRVAVICRVPPIAPLTVADLQRAHPDLVGDWLLPSGLTSWQPFIDEAFDELIARLLEHGTGPHLIASWSVVRRVLKRMALLEIATHLAMSRDGSTRWADLAAVLGASADEPRSVEAAWASLFVRLDRDENGAVDTDDDLQSRPGVYAAAVASPAGRGF